MRIGIIGGGVAGLSAAWLLSDEHDVTLFEAQPRLGGHAHTVHAPRHEADEAGDRIAVEAGFEFFSRRLWPSFNRLLAQLDVPLRDYPTRLSVRRVGASRARLLQPLDIDGRLVLSMLTPTRLLDLAQFGLLLASVSPLMKARDTSITLGEVLARAPLTRSFHDEFLFPLLLAGWSVEPDDFREFAAYDALRYAYMSVTPRGAVAMQEVVGGLSRYVEALVKQIPRATLRSPARIASVERSAQHEGGFRVREDDGRTHAFEHLIVATNAKDCAKLLADVRGAERIVQQASRIEYFPTTIAVHGDDTYMPAHPDDWGIVNVRHDGRYAQSTVWKPWRGRKLFRSWVSYDDRMPEHLHQLVQFEHPKANLRYFEVQRALGALQGQDGLWLAGMHMHDIDSHESALRSAIHVVQRLSPSAPRLASIA